MRYRTSVLIAAAVLMAAPGATLARATAGKFHDEFPAESGGSGGTAWAVVDAVSGLVHVADTPP